MRRFVAPLTKGGDVAGWPASVCLLAWRGRLPLPGPGTAAAAAGGPVGGWVGDCVAWRGGAARMFRGGTGMVLPEGSAGIAPCSGQVRVRGAHVRCLRAGWNLSRGNGVGLGMAGPVTGAVLIVGG